LQPLRDRLGDGIRARLDDVRLTGHPVERLPGTVNLAFRHVESESIVLGLDLKGVAVSAGSACTSGHVEPSHVLTALGLPRAWAMGAVRFSLGSATTTEDVDVVIECVESVVSKLRRLLPTATV
jgi:cysteine desulfurase